jgi:hypothetical protein
MTPEPKGKLDTMAMQPATMLAADAVVNGPPDEPLETQGILTRHGFHGFHGFHG